MFASALCPISHPPLSAPRAVTSKVHLHSGHSALVMQKPTPQAFKIKMRSKDSSEHVRTFLNGYAPHAKELCCSMSYQFALELQSLPNQHSSTSGCLHHRQWHISTNILCQRRHSDTHTAVIRFLLNQYQTEGCFKASAFHVCS